MARPPVQAPKQSADFLSHRGLVSCSVQDDVRAADFVTQRHLMLDTPERLCARQPIAPLQTSDLCFTVGGHDHDLVDALVSAGLEQERHFIDNDRLGRTFGDLAGKTLLCSGHARMDDALESSKPLAVAKDNLTECPAVDRPVRVQDVFAEHLYDLAPRRLSGPHDISSELIGVDDECPVTLEHLRDSAFPRRDSSGQPQHDHAPQNSMRIFKMSLSRAPSD